LSSAWSLYEAYIKNWETAKRGGDSNDCNVEARKTAFIRIGRYSPKDLSEDASGHWSKVKFWTVQRNQKQEDKYCDDHVSDTTGMEAGQKNACVLFISFLSGVRGPENACGEPEDAVKSTKFDEKTCLRNLVGGLDQTERLFSIYKGKENDWDANCKNKKDNTVSSVEDWKPFVEKDCEVQFLKTYFANDPFKTLTWKPVGTMQAWMGRRTAIVSPTLKFDELFTNANDDKQWVVDKKPGQFRCAKQYIEAYLTVLGISQGSFILIDGNTPSGDWSEGVARVFGLTKCGLRYSDKMLKDSKFDFSKKITFALLEELDGEIQELI